MNVTTQSQVFHMDLSQISKLLDDIMDDRSVPRNIRLAVEDARRQLADGKADATIRISGAIMVLDEVSGDPNIPVYTRTQIWNIVSMLEVIGKNE